jgi:hypothetical protein
VNPITRPNGKIYRPTKIRAHVTYTGYPEDDGVIVLGTQDPDEALPYAQRTLDYSPLSGCYPAEQWSKGWWRNTIRNHESFWEWDAVRGAAGVCFEVTDDEDTRYAVES